MFWILPDEDQVMLPRLLRAHVTLPAATRATDEDMLATLARRLEREGARQVRADGELVRFEASGMGFNVSPLAVMTDGWFKVERDAGRIRVDYGFRPDLLTGRGVLCVLALLALCFLPIMYGSFAPAVIGLLFYGLGVAGTYFYYSAWMSRTVAASLAVPSPAPARIGSTPLATTR